MPSRPPPHVSLKDVEEARERLRGVAWRTPCLPASRDDDGRLLVKYECLQRTGSFKIRGAWNRMSRCTPAERAKGFVTVSAGNHGQAVAWSARRLGAPCVVWVPDNAVERKVRAMESMGAVVKRLPHDEIMRIMTTDEWAVKQPQTYIHPFGDPLVVAGQGTIGLEILEDVPDVATVIAPVGGGGLSTGIAQALRAKGSRAKVYGVQAAGAAPVPASLAAGRPVRVGPPQTFADGMAATFVFDYMFPALQEFLAGCFAVSEDELRAAVRHLAREGHAMVEGAGAGALAAAWKHRADLTEPIVCIASGGNIDPALHADILLKG